MSKVWSVHQLGMDNGTSFGLFGNLTSGGKGQFSDAEKLWSTPVGLSRDPAALGDDPDALSFDSEAAVDPNFFHSALKKLSAERAKNALYHLVEHLRNRRFELFDIQMVTAATQPFGAKNISRRKYLNRLSIAVTRDGSF